MDESKQRTLPTTAKNLTRKPKLSYSHVILKNILGTILIIRKMFNCKYFFKIIMFTPLICLMIMISTAVILFRVDVVSQCQLIPALPYRIHTHIHTSVTFYG